MKLINVLLIFLIGTIYATSQDLNSYKYILVPETFKEMKEPDQYRLNGLTNYLFNENGFLSFIGKSNLPQEAFNSNCLVLNAELIKESGFFITKVAIQLKNCRDEVVYTSPLGESKAKKFIVAYNEALRASLNNLSSLNYKYQPKNETILKAEQPIVETPKVSPAKNLDKENASKKTVIIEQVTTSEPLLKAVKVGNSPFDYEVFNSENKLVYTLLFSGIENVYIIKNTDALLYKKEKVWVIVDRSSANMQLKVLNITFN